MSVGAVAKVQLIQGRAGPRGLPTRSGWAEPQAWATSTCYETALYSRTWRSEASQSNLLVRTYSSVKMLVRISSVRTMIVWLLAILMAVFASRYFFPGLLRPPETQLVARHSFWAILHIGGAIIAIVAGPFQFVTSLRNGQPRVHRGLGYLYVTAVMLSGIAGVRLSPDSAKYFSQAMTDAATTTSFGYLPRLAGYHAGEIFTEKELWPTVPSFFLLSLAWLWTTGMALWRARQRQFDLHRAWMTRSYSLTFGAVTIRVLSFPLALLSQNPLFAAIAAVWSWPLNLLVAEFLIRSGSTVSDRTTATA